MSLPLDGIRVLDFTRMFAGPCAAETLADLGADVVKVEEPRVGDPTRRNLPFWGEESAYFMSLNRGKRSISLDLKDPLGRQIAWDLAVRADIVVENYRPYVMQRLELDYERLKAANSAVIYCSLSGFGASGPLRDKISFDLVNQAMAGMIDLTGDPLDRPVRIGVPVGDMAGGLYLALAAVAALRGRGRTGLGCWVDLSLHDVLIALLGHHAQRYFDSGKTPCRTGHRHAELAPVGAYAARDGWFVLAAVQDREWQELTNALGLAGLRDDDRLASAQGRKEHEAEFDQHLVACFRQGTVAEWVDVLGSAGVPVAPVNSLRDGLESPLVQERGIVFTAEHPGVGPVRNLASPMIFDGVRAGIGGVSPQLGANTRDVLREAGIAEEELAELAEQGVIRPSSERPSSSTPN